MVVNWEPNGDYDFKDYTILYSTSQFSGFSPLHQIFENDQTRLILNEFDPTIENWFKVQTTDIWSQEVVGEAMVSEIDAFPTVPAFNSISYDNNNFMFRVDNIKIPFPFIKLQTLLFMVQHDENTLYVYAIQMGIISKTSITIKSLTTSSCEITMNYKFYLCLLNS